MEKVASKLGLISDPRVLRKALEYERLLKLKISLTNNISDSTRAVICLDLAAETFDIPFDTTLALKLAALHKTAYNNLKYTIGRNLKLTDDININSLCVQLGCPSALDCAFNLLQTYQLNDIKNSDWTHPQYACMAVYQACKMQNIKISKSSILPYSRLKPSQWKNLKEEWKNIAVKSNLQFETTRSKNNIHTNDQNQIKVMPSNDDISYKNDTILLPSAIQSQEDYDIWKEKILLIANEEILKLKL